MERNTYESFPQLVIQYERLVYTVCFQLVRDAAAAEDLTQESFLSARLSAGGYLAVTAWLCRGVRLDARALALGGITCALTLVLASLYIPLPTGSTITAGSMLPLMLLAVVYDYRLAFLTGWVTGILSLFLIPTWQPVHWAQIFVEHLVCFSCLGYAGIFGGSQKQKLLLGVVLAVFLKFTGHVLSGVVFFSQNAWDGWGAWAYSLTYHLTSKVPEGIATGAVLLALPVTLFKKVGKAGACA